MDWEGHLGKKQLCRGNILSRISSQGDDEGLETSKFNSASRITSGRPAEFLHQAGNQQRCWPTLQLLLETSGIEITCRNRERL